MPAPDTSPPAIPPINCPACASLPPMTASEVEEMELFWDSPEAFRDVGSEDDE